MAAAFATTDDVVARGRALGATELDVADTLLRDASDDLRARVPRLDERIADGTLNAGLPKRVAVRMVIDALATVTNPGRLRSEQVEDVTLTYDLTQMRQHLVPTADELALLRPPGRARRPRGIGTGRMRPVL